MALKRKHAEENDHSPSEGTDVFRSEPITDRKSTFIGFFSPSLKPKDLQSLPETAKADHRILGWRKESNQQSITKVKQYVTGCDDDGEKYGGKRIENVLNAMQVEGACVVARWWGGVLLGPVRFTHIESCARDAIRHYQSGQADAQLKKRKVEADEAEHARLAKTLVERDQSIEVLRALAAEKEQKVKEARDPGGEHTGEKSPQKTAPPSSSAKAPGNYLEFPLDRLRALDKARDATLSFLLARIDRAEADLLAVKADEKPL